MQRLQLSSLVVSTTEEEEDFAPDAAELVRRVGRDGVRRLFHNLGEVLGSLDCFRHLTIVRVQLAHLVRRRYIVYEEERFASLQASSLPGLQGGEVHEINDSSSYVAQLLTGCRRRLWKLSFSTVSSIPVQLSNWLPLQCHRIARHIDLQYNCSEKSAKEGQGDTVETRI